MGGVLNEKMPRQHRGGFRAEADSFSGLEDLLSFTFPVTAALHIVVMLTLSAHASRTKSLEDVLVHIASSSLSLP